MNCVLNLDDPLQKEMLEHKIMDNFSDYINYVEKLKDTEINFTEIDLAPESIKN